MAKTQIEFPTQVNVEEKISDWAHDLRSPFNHVIGFTKIVLNGKSGPLTELQKEDLTIVFHSSLRAISLINNLIEIARLQRGEKEINRAPLELQAFLDKAVAQWQKANPGIKMPIAALLTTDSASARLDKQQLTWTLNGFLSYLAAYADGTGGITLEISEETDALVFSLHHTGITKKGYDQISLEMCAFICRAYIELQGGEIRLSDLDESEAMIQFTIPK